jgi:hypothetical protein
MGNMMDKVYNAIDIFLTDLASEKAYSLSGMPLSAYTQEQSLALEILNKYNLIDIKGSQPQVSVVHITTPGLRVIEMGGIRNFLRSLETQGDFSTEIRKLTTQVLEMQVQDKLKDDALKYIQTRIGELQLEDYPQTKIDASKAIKNASNANNTAIISLIIAGITLIIMAIATVIAWITLKQ